MNRGPATICWNWFQYNKGMRSWKKESKPGCDILFNLDISGNFKFPFDLALTVRS